MGLIVVIFAVVVHLFDDVVVIGLNDEDFAVEDEFWGDVVVIGSTDVDVSIEVEFMLDVVIINVLVGVDVLIVVI